MSMWIVCAFSLVLILIDAEMKTLCDTAPIPSSKIVPKFTRVGQITI